MNKVKLKDGKFVVEGNKKTIDQKDVYKEKMKAYSPSYDTVLKGIDDDINRIDDNDPNAIKKEEKLRAKKAAVLKMAKSIENETK